MAQYSRPDWADKIARSSSPGKCSWCQREFGPGERRVLQPKVASAHPVYPCEPCYNEYLGNLGPEIKADPPWRIPSSTAGATPPRPTTIIRRVGPKMNEPFNPALPAKRRNPHMYGYRDNPSGPFRTKPGKKPLAVIASRVINVAVLDYICEILGIEKFGDQDVDPGIREFPMFSDLQWVDFMKAIQNALESYLAERGQNAAYMKADQFTYEQAHEVAQRMVDDGTAARFLFQTPAQAYGRSGRYENPLGENELPIRNDRSVVFAILDAVSRKLGKPTVGEYNERGQREVSEIPDEKWSEIVSAIKRALDKYCAEVGIDPRETPAREFPQVHIEAVAQRLVDDGTAMSFFQTHTGIGASDATLFMAIMSALSSMVGPAPDLREMTDEQAELFTAYLNDARMEALSEDAEDIASRMVGHGFSWDLLRQARHSGRYENPGPFGEDEDLDTFGRMCVLIYDQLAFILGPAPDLSDMDEDAAEHFVEEVQKFMAEGAEPTQETARQIAGDMIAHGFVWSQISKRRNPYVRYGRHGY